MLQRTIPLIFFIFLGGLTSHIRGAEFITAAQAQLKILADYGLIEEAPDLSEDLKEALNQAATALRKTTQRAEVIGASTAFQNFTHQLDAEAQKTSPDVSTLALPFRTLQEGLQQKMAFLASWKDQLELVHGHLGHLGLWLPLLQQPVRVAHSAPEPEPAPLAPAPSVSLTRAQRAVAAQNVAALANLGSDSDSDSEEEEHDALNYLITIKAALEDKENRKWLERHGVSIDKMRSTLAYATQREGQDGDFKSFFDVISQTRHHEAQVVKKMRIFFHALKNRGLFPAEATLPDGDSEQTIRAAFHAMLRTSIEGPPINSAYAPYQEALDTAYNQLLCLCPEGIIGNGQHLTAQESKRITTDLLHQFEPVCEISNLYQQARTLAEHYATKDGAPLTDCTEQTEVIFEGLRGKLALARRAQESMASGRVIDKIQHDIDKRAHETDPAHKQTKKRDAAFIPHTTFTLPTNIPVAPGHRSFIPRQWVDGLSLTSAAETENSFAASTDLTHQEQPLWKVLPRVVHDLQGKRHYTYNHFNDSDIADWQRFNQELVDGNIFADKFGKKQVTRATVADYQNRPLYWKQTSTTPGVTPWYEPLRPSEHQLLTAPLFKEVGSFGSSHKLEHFPVDGLNGNIAPPNNLYQENLAVRPLVSNTTTYITQTNPTLHLVKEGTGSFREIGKTPIVSVGVYPGFFKKLSASGIEIGIQGIIHKSFRKARIAFCQNVFKERAEEIATLLKAGDYRKISKLFRFVPYNPFKSKSLLHLLGYIALHEGMHWARRKLIAPNFSTALAHKFDQLGSAAFSRIQETRNLYDGRTLVRNQLGQNPMKVVHGMPIPLHPVIDQMVSGRHTLLSPIDALFSFFVNEGVDSDSVRNIRGVINAQMLGNEQAFHRGSTNARPFFYKSEWFKFARRLLISFFTIRSLDSNYLNNMITGIKKKKHVLIKALRACRSNSASQATQAAEFTDTFVTQHSQLTGGSFIGWLLKKLRAPKAGMLLGDAQIIFASRVKASLMVNALLALPTIAKLIYIPLKQVIQQQGGNSP